ncbi:hypothetical protein L6164_021635 [Bauhinia variegata]|uniref:Uncharacterized protein n=1 Tax=Bauhinia variegata TaxID=167791 RepID=A0ACB9MYX1_BAUVA|nr:hypothetical protein L6164_021635 [Bauhinia variegata]
MARVSAVPVEVLLSKRVQEMVLNGEEPPPPYVSRDDEPAQHDPDAFCSHVPLIDFGLLSSPSTDEQKQQELEKLGSALSAWGCFQAINHGIPSSVLDEIRQVAREFFEQPMEQKCKISKGLKEFEGYGADPVPEQGQSLDWSDRLFLDVYPPERKKFKLWPENPPSFRGVLEEYTVEMRKLTERISRVMAKSLNLEENCFLNQFGEGALLQARFNYYSPCQRPDLILGLKPHADGSGYTLILQDDVEGLQIHHHGNWFTVPTIPHALVVLMADQMEIMTNGVFRSPVHRVLTNSERERISIAMFYTPEPDKEIGPEDGLVNEKQPKLYKKMKGYADTHWEYYQRGMRAIHIAKV